MASYRGRAETTACGGKRAWRGSCEARSWEFLKIAGEPVFGGHAIAVLEAYHQDRTDAPQAKEAFMTTMTVQLRSIPDTEAALGRAGGHTIVVDRPDGKAGGMGLG